MSRPTDIPDIPLSDAPSLMDFLQRTLEQLEAASGGVDEEARAALAKLHGVTVSPPAPSAEDTARIASMSNEQLAAHLAGLEQQMTVVEGLLAGSSAETRSLVAESTAVWTGKDADGPAGGGTTKKDQSK